MLHRLDFALPAALTKLSRPPSAYLRENVHYTLSGWTYPATFLNLLLEVGIDRIMFSADYPFHPMAAARTFLEQLPVSPVDRTRIAHGNEGAPPNSSVVAAIRTSVRETAGCSSRRRSNTSPRPRPWRVYNGCGPLALFSIPLLRICGESHLLGTAPIL